MIGKDRQAVHEVGITQSILDIAIDNARREGAKHISSLTVEIGGLSGVIPEAVEFCFEAVTRGTMAEGASLNIIHTPGKGRCLDCHALVELDPITFNCSACESYNLERLQGDELRLIELEID